MELLLLLIIGILSVLPGFPSQDDDVQARDISGREPTGPAITVNTPADAPRPTTFGEEFAAGATDLAGKVGDAAEGIGDFFSGEGGGDRLTPEVADEIRFQKQCFLAHNMLNVHAGILEFEQRPAGTPLTNPAGHTVLRGSPAADLTSLIVSRPEIQALMEVKPQLLSYLLPYIRLYKVYGSPRDDLVIPGAPPDNEEIEFVFETHLSRNDIDQITTSRSGRPGGVGLESFGWEFLGVNAAEVENNIQASLSLHFNNMKDFEKERTTPGTEYKYHFSDLIVSESMYLAADPADIDEEGQKFNPRFFRLKVVAGWAVPPHAGAERETFEQVLGDIRYDEFQELIRLNKKVMYLNLINHDLSFNQDGSMSLNATYQAMVEGTFSNERSDILKVGVGDSTRATEGVLEQIGDDIRRIQDVARCSAGQPGSTVEIELPEGGRSAIRFSHGEEADSDEERDELSDLQEDMATHRRDAQMVLSLYERRDRALAYSTMMRRLMESNRIYRATVRPEALGFQSFPFDENIERGHLTRAAQNSIHEAYTSTGGTGFLPREEIGLGERLETFRATQLSWWQATLGFGDQESEAVQQQDERARQQIEVDPGLLRRMLAINRFYAVTDFAVERIGGVRPSGPGCGDIFGVIGALANMSEIDLSSMGKGELEQQFNQNEEQLVDAIARMRSWVVFGDSATQDAATGDIHTPAVPVDFILFGDLIDAVMASDMDWIEENNVEIYLGTFIYNDPASASGRSTGPSSVSIPLAYIPVSLELFSMWFLEEIIEQRVTQMALREFIRSVFNKLVVSAFGSECVYDPAGKFSLTQESLSVVPEFYTIPKYKIARAMARTDGANAPRGTVDYENMLAVIRSAENPLHLLDYEGDTWDDYFNIVIYQHRSADTPTSRIHETDMGATPYLDVVEEDIDQGIYHLNIGSDRGLVKTISFSRMDQQYLMVARMQNSGDLAAGYRQRYNATVSMFGNMFFYPGQHIYINPSMVGAGTVPTQRGLTTLLGIGGYYFIQKVENVIERGLFETILACSWVSSGFNTASTPKNGPTCDTNVLLDRTYGTTDPPDEGILEEVPELIEAGRERVGEIVHQVKVGVTLAFD